MVKGGECSMKIGKKLGLIAFVCAILVVILAFVGIAQAPEIRPEVYEMMTTDMELAEEMMMEDMEKAPLLFKIADTGITILGLVGVVLAIVSLVKMVKGNEKGKVFPILAIILIVVFFFVYTFGAVDMGQAFQAGLDAGMSMQE